MKVAILCESPLDQIALRVLVDAVLGVPTEWDGDDPRLRPAWPGVLAVLPGVVRALYFGGIADGLVVVADSDTTPLHRPGSIQTPCQPACRFCQVQQAVNGSLARVSPVAGRMPLQTAVGSRDTRVVQLRHRPSRDGDHLVQCTREPSLSV